MARLTARMFIARELRRACIGGDLVPIPAAHRASWLREASRVIDGLRSIGFVILPRKVPRVKRRARK